MAVLKKTVNCPRRMTVYAIFDVLDKLNSVYEQELAGDITARVNVFDNLNDFALAVTQQGDSSIIHISMLRPAAGLTEQGQQRALGFLMDSIVQHIENEANTMTDKREEAR